MGNLTKVDQVNDGLQSDGLRNKFVDFCDLLYVPVPRSQGDVSLQHLSNFVHDSVEHWWQLALRIFLQIRLLLGTLLLYISRIFAAQLVNDGLHVSNGVDCVFHVYDLPA